MKEIKPSSFQAETYQVDESRPISPISPESPEVDEHQKTSNNIVEKTLSLDDDKHSDAKSLER